MHKAFFPSLFCMAALYAGWQLLQARRRRATAHLIAEAAKKARTPLPRPSATVLSFTCRAEPGAPLSQAFP